MASSMTPEISVRMMAIVGSFSPDGNVGAMSVPKVAVIKDMIAVGPRVISLDVPKKTYTKQPMNAEYNPYCGYNCKRKQIITVINIQFSQWV